MGTRKLVVSVDGAGRQLHLTAQDWARALNLAMAAPRRRAGALSPALGLGAGRVGEAEACRFADALEAALRYVVMDEHDLDPGLRYALSFHVLTEPQKKQVRDLVALFRSPGGVDFAVGLARLARTSTS
jgi:hypothetical protein